MIYRTVQGDTWDVVSLKNYSDEGFVGMLIQANPGYRDTVFFTAGAELQIPPKPPISDVSNLPPWVRG